MPCPHNEITIVQRSQRQSAVAAAAYQSGEKLFCEYDQQVKHYPEKRGIVHNEILLPPNAPQEYADRNTLWNAAEAVEKQWNSQLARRWVLTIPREIPPDQYAVLVREFCQKQFVSKGMIADFAIHDPHPPGHNPHAHVMLTMRAMDEHGKWLPKSRKVYDLDENGERIKLPSGRWKSHKEDTVDWNDQKYCEIWRHEWEVIQNRYLEANDRPERVDLRSYARQGLDIVPTVHEGAAVRQMEKRGIQTNIGNLNREIRAANRLMKSIRQLIQNLKGWITELGEKRKELLAQKAAEEATLLPNLLMKYMEIRKEERKDWTRAGQNRGTSQDLKAVSEALSYLRQKGLSTVEDLEAFLESSGKSAADYRNQMKPKEARSKVIDGILASRTDCKECTGVTMPAGRRTELLHWASRCPGQRYIIEDDYDSEFRFDTRPLPSLQGMAGADGPVVYLSTCSRSLAPGIRIAYMVLPRQLLPAWRAKYRIYSCTVSRFEQQTLARFIREGYFTRHLARERVAYKARRDALAASLRAAFAPDELTLTGLHTGLHLLARLKNAPPDAALRAAAKAQGVALSLLSDYDLTGGEQDFSGTFVLGYGSLSEASFPEAGETLRKVCTAAWEASVTV